MKRLIRYIFFAANCVVAFGLLLAYLVPGIDPRYFWPVSIFGLAYPVLLTLNVAFLIFWLIFKYKYSLLSLIVILSGISIHTTFFQFRGNDKGNGNKEIKVLSYNVHHFHSYFEGKKRDQAVLNFIREQQAQVICLQETMLQRKGILNPLTMKQLFPGIVHCQLAHQSPWGGPVTFSAYPIHYMGEIRFSESGNLVIYSDIVTEEDTIRVYNCHLQSFGISDDEKTILDSISFRNRQIDEIKQVIKKLKDGYIRRAKQVDILVEHIIDCPYPVIVCGDFNDTPISYTYRKVRKIVRDSFVGSGCGISRTYKEKVPPVRIDYIFHSDHFRSKGYMRHKVGYSDHYPITVTLERVEEKKAGDQ